MYKFGSNISYRTRTHIPDNQYCPVFFFLNRSPPISGFLDDYAFIICGLLDLYEATMQTEWLQWAEELQLRQDTLFWDSAGGGYFCSDPSDSTVLLQLKEGERETYSHISLAYQ